MTKDVGISVVVCCFNSASRLSTTLLYLAKQNTKKLNWEIIVVDNNSSDNTAQVAKNKLEVYDLQNGSFKVVHERRPGLNRAREKGIEVSKFKYVIFCDDDNWLSENYVIEMYNLFESDKTIGIIGSDSYPSYEGNPPKWFIDNSFHFAIGQHGQEEDVTDTRGAVWGAGMAVRKSMLNDLKSRNFKMLLSDRVGKKMTTGGDSELCFALKAIGYKIFYTKRCSLIHFMPEARYNLKKFYELTYNNKYIENYLNCLNLKCMPTKKDLVKTFVGRSLKFPKRQAVKRALGISLDDDSQKIWHIYLGTLMGDVFVLKNYKTVKRNIQSLK